MRTRHAWRSVVNFSFHQFYNRFAFTYDMVSALVSRGEWRTWTRAAIPFIQGTRVLEIAVGTGNLHLDLYAAGYVPFGVDLSPYMLAQTARKFRARGMTPRLARASVMELPFPDGYFSTLVMTFPPGFIYDLNAMREMHRVLEVGGVLLWVDSPALDTSDAWGRFLNTALRVTGGCANPSSETILGMLRTLHGGALWRMWAWRVETVQCAHSQVRVFRATKEK